LKLAHVPRTGVKPAIREALEAHDQVEPRAPLCPKLLGEAKKGWPDSDTNPPIHSPDFEVTTSRASPQPSVQVTEEVSHLDLHR
jgi:hypothetical protein